MKILVADDDRLFLENASTVLSRAGHEVVVATAGDEALDKAVLEGPDLIIMDVGLPGLPGSEVCESLRVLKKTSRIPILLTNACIKSIEEASLDPAKPSANDFLQKPFSAEALLQRIDCLISQIRQ